MVKRALLFLSVVLAWAPVQAELVRVASATATGGEGGYQAGIYDAGTGYAFFASTSVVEISTQGVISRFVASPLAYSTHVFISSGMISAALLDSTSGYAYFASTRTPADISKMNLSTSVQIASQTLAGVDFIRMGVVDAAAGFIYWGTHTDPGQIVKMDMTSLQMVATLPLATGSSFLTTGLIDSNGTYAYFASSTTPPTVSRIRLSNFTLDSTLTLDPTDGPIVSGAIDSSEGYAWFGTNQSPGKVIRVRLSGFIRSTQDLVLNTGENNLTSVVYDPAYQGLYFGTDTSSGIVVHVNGGSMQRRAALTLNAGDDRLQSAAIDTTNHYAYFGTYVFPARIIQIDLIGGAPTITQQPASQTVSVGQSATFTIAATGRSLTYQWQRGGVAISGANSTSYTVPVVTFADDGASFTCVVTSSSGTVTSNAAVLTVQSDVHAYPNPWRADQHAGTSMFFNGLPVGSQVKIYTLNAQWVRSIPESGQLATWDLRNDKGENVSSGYYFYIVDSPSGRQKIRGKIAIIR